MAPNDTPVAGSNQDKLTGAVAVSRGWPSSAYHDRESDIAFGRTASPEMT